MPDRPRNVGAAIRQRLLNLAHARGQPMELLLTRYALERLLHRLSLSPHRERFVLKGALLLTTWFDECRDPGHGEVANGQLDQMGRCIREPARALRSSHADDRFGRPKEVEACNERTPNGHQSRAPGMKSKTG